jgi:hypothetical protein
MAFLLHAPTISLTNIIQKYVLMDELRAVD